MKVNLSLIALSAIVGFGGAYTVSYIYERSPERYTSAVMDDALKDTDQLGDKAKLCQAWRTDRNGVLNVVTQDVSVHLQGQRIDIPVIERKMDTYCQ